MHNSYISPNTNYRWTAVRDGSFLECQCPEGRCLGGNVHSRAELGNEVD